MTAHIPVGLRVHLTMRRSRPSPTAAAPTSCTSRVPQCIPRCVRCATPSTSRATRGRPGAAAEHGRRRARPSAPRRGAHGRARRAGWSTVTTFETGSAFEHAASLWHTALGWVDVHRIFPGITADPDAAFDELWRDRSEALSPTAPAPSRP